MNRRITACALALSMALASSCGGSDEAEGSSTSTTEPGATTTAASTDTEGDAGAANEFCEYADAYLNAEMPGFERMTDEQLAEFDALSPEDAEALTDEGFEELGGYEPTDEQVDEFEKLEAESVEGMIEAAPQEIKSEMEALGKAFVKLNEEDADLGGLATEENMASMDKVFAYVESDCGLGMDPIDG